MGLTRDGALAQDIVQETLFRAWRKPEVLEQKESSARAWLFTVARNLVIDDRRSARHSHEVVTDVIPEPARASVSVDTTDHILDAWTVADALSTLSHDHRAVLVHAYYGGRGIAEIARELDIPEGTVKSRLHYASRALRLALQEKGMTR